MTTNFMKGLGVAATLAIASLVAATPAAGQLLNGSKHVTTPAFAVANAANAPSPLAYMRAVPVLTLPAGTPKNGSLLPSLPAVGLPRLPGTPELPNLAHLSPLSTIPNLLPVSTSAPIAGVLGLVGGLPIPATVPGAPSPQPIAALVLGQAPTLGALIAAAEPLAAAGSPIVAIVASTPVPSAPSTALPPLPPLALPAPPAGLPALPSAPSLPDLPQAPALPL